MQVTAEAFGILNAVAVSNKGFPTCSVDPDLLVEAISTVIAKAASQATSDQCTSVALTHLNSVTFVDFINNLLA